MKLPIPALSAFLYFFCGNFSTYLASKARFTIKLLCFFLRPAFTLFYKKAPYFFIFLKNPYFSCALLRPTFFYSRPPFYLTYVGGGRWPTFFL